MESLTKKIYDMLNDRYYFKMVYLFMSLVFVTVLKIIPGIFIINKVVLLWAIIILIFSIFNDYKRRKFYKFDIPLGIFIVITFFYNLLIYRTNENIKIWVVNLILFIVIFTIDVFKNKQILMDEVYKISRFYVIMMLFISLSSFAMKLFNISFTVGVSTFSGLKGGVFENENAISIAAAIAFLLCLYINNSTENYKSKMFWFANAVLQGITTFSFYGRSAYLILIAVVYTFLFIYNKNKFIRVVLIIIPLIATVAAYEIEGSHVRDFTSGRTSLWTSASIVIKENPLVGVGYSDFVEAVRNARQTDDLPGLEIGGVHNIYVQVATINGLTSLLALLAFIILILSFIVKRLDNLRKKQKLKMTILTSLTVGILAVNVFESNLVYIVSFISIIFWIYLGYLISILDNKNIE